MLFLAPCPMATKAMTEAMPMTMPSTVSPDRTLLTVRARNDSCRTSVYFITRHHSSPKLTAGAAGPLSPTINPSCRRMVRLARSATADSWVMSTMVCPVAFKAANVSRMISPVLVSRLPVGSSARISAGSLTSARAIATRWIWPPESWLERCDQRSSSRPDLLQRFLGPRSRSAFGTPR